MSIIDDLQKKLEGGKFRLLNEKIYKNKELTRKEAQEYHKCYLSQIKKWPSDPKRTIIKMIKDRDTPEDKIADLGCGSGEVAKEFKNVDSFDKYPANKSIIECELSSVPSEDKTYDVAICCLSLMTTSISPIIREVNRILKIGGVFYISEVTSRVINMKSLINHIEKIGFKLKNFDKSNKYFFIHEFEKVTDVVKDGKYPNIKLNPWVYKKR